jgi:RHS repeat-associated protein
LINPEILVGGFAMTRAIMRWTAAALVFGAVVQSEAAFADTQTRTSSFAYHPTTGLLTQEVVEPDTPALRLQTDYVHDVRGNKTSVTISGVDIVTRSATTTYDAQAQFATGASNALGQSETGAYDPRFGQPTSHTGPNGLTTTWTYDTFGRKTLEVRADGTRTSFSYLFCSGINGGSATCVSGAYYLVKTTPLAADGVTKNGPVGIVYFDQIDREITRQTEGFDGSTIVAAKQYNSRGHVSKTSRPYFVSGGTPQWTQFAHDDLGRVGTTTAPDGSISTRHYQGLVTVDINAKGQHRTVVKNSQGNVVSVTDELGNTMTHAYDAMGNLKQTTDAVGNVIAASYDVRGRKIASSDPNLGYWTYSYNTLGQVVSQTDAKSQVTTITYDKLGRPTQRVEPDMTSAWTYDTAANGIGKLAASSITAGPGAGFQRSVAYDTLGRPSQVATTIDSATYTFSAGYDANSRLSTVSYPSGFVARYSYNALGYANQLRDNATSQVHWTAVAMDAESHLTHVTAGNGLSTIRLFDAATGRLNSIVTGAGHEVQDVSYTYDLLGNPLSRVDNNLHWTESFTYDALNRLTSTTVNSFTPSLVKNFTYSPIGNMLSKSDVGTYTYPAAGSARPHAVTSIAGGAITTTFAYDANGNQTSGLGRTIAWTSYNKPSSITQGARTISFLDDTAHQRVKQVTPEGTTIYIGAFGVLAEVDNPGTASQKWTEYLSVGNAKVGMRTLQTATSTLTTRYFHTDHLGSISVITNEAGAVVQRLSYDAWGKRRHPDGADDTTNSITSETKRGFTAEEHLSVGGLVHLNGRVYDTLLARMISADPFVTDPMNQQGWNRYSYVGNDPLAFTDPNGYSWFSRFFRSVGRAVSNFFNSVAKFLQTNPIARAITQIVVTGLLAIVIPGVGLALSGVTLSAVAAFGGASITTGLAGGSLSQALRAGAIAGVTAAAFYVVGAATDVAQGRAFSLTASRHLQPAFGTPEHVFQVAGHAAVGCGSSVLSGGSCGSGALAAAAGAVGAPLVGNLPPVGRIAASAVLGGIGSVAGGGSFANGAVTGAFGYMFNTAAGALRGSAYGGAFGGFVGGLTGFDPLAALGTSLGIIAGAVIGDWVTGPDVVLNETKDTLKPGPYAGDSIPARGPERDFTPEERARINEIGRETGCHTCGATDPGTRSGNHIPDHQPANGLNPEGGAQRLYPHCLSCSRIQGGQVRAGQWE